ncbi:MAG: hypothetical protein PHF70_03140 [Opitutales bacterium]|nr:hypothetical protein [Opitutales bacterium]
MKKPLQWGNEYTVITLKEIDPSVLFLRENEQPIASKTDDKQLDSI